ncbi:hypothetical protein QH494_26660 [Sphingomonas sp. AR_OL41]|uniref:hypothetical protein n=1 Tax=Sphingomonas sp. AR_OL41 TaxID=3042729 RepID=UPI0024811D50|nr:hypothetical protein [Sphingomonas sp. AR_OL41]MDH7975782.1 hypothetical protein [Sphingomonas sp. AR_OL41]
MNEDAQCEACRNAAISVIVDDDDPADPYRVCEACAARLRHRALRPLEWFNLAAVHGWTRYLLHDDFYDQDGEATQPDTDGYSTDRLLAPTISEARASLPRMVDFCVTRWWLDAPEFVALRTFAPTDPLGEVARRAARGGDRLLGALLTIAANALGPVAAEWVRAQRDRALGGGLLFDWCEAAARCLPAPEGLDLAIEALGRLDTRALAQAKGGLLWFRSACVLDWIETHAPGSNVTEDWGRLAALSDLDLARIRAWIAAGRPLSLVALDALAAFVPRAGQAPVFRRLDPALRGVEDRGDIEDLLHLARANDPSPRVMRIADYVSGHLGQVRIESGL